MKQLLFPVAFLAAAIVLWAVYKPPKELNTTQPPPIILPPVVSDPPVTATIPDDSLPNTEIDELLRRSAGRAGISAAVIKDGKFLYKGGAGTTSNGENTTAYTNYRMASVSKQFTAAAIMLCKDRGLLNFDDPIRKFFPDMPEWANEITVRHLLNHRSTFPRDGAALVDGTVTDRKIVEALTSSQRRYSTGGFSYCNTGFCVLAVIVEKASGQSYPDFMRDNFFGPLGMKNSCIYEDGKEIQHRAMGTPTDQSRTSKTWGDGCVYTSVHEYWAWDQALYRGDFIKQETLAEAFKPVSGYGFGWFVNGNTISHSGATVGFQTYVVRYPSEKLTIVVFMNSEGSPGSIASRIAQIVRR